MFNVFYTNFGYSAPQDFATVEDAIEYARSKGFEATIDDGNNLVASWSPIRGTRRYPVSGE